MNKQQRNIPTNKHSYGADELTRAVQDMKHGRRIKPVTYGYQLKGVLVKDESEQAVIRQIKQRYKTGLIPRRTLKTVIDKNMCVCTGKLLDVQMINTILNSDHKQGEYLAQ